MIVRHEAIILRTQNYQDSSLIVQVLTEGGVRSLLAKGQRSAKSTKRLPLWPLALVEVVYYEKGSRSLQTLSECALMVPMPTLMAHPAKMLYGTLAAELCTSVLRPGGDDIEAYHLLRQYLQDLEASNGPFYWPFMRFVLELSQIAGIYPDNQVPSEGSGFVSFDIRHGSFIAAPYLAPDAADQLLHFLAYGGTAWPPSDGAVRRRCLERLLLHFSMHLEGFRQPLSLQVFSEAFAAE